MVYPKNNNKTFILLNIKNRYKDGMSKEEIYQVTKEAWRIDKQKIKKVRHAIAIYNKNVKGIFSILRWYRNDDGRWGFDGKLVSPDMYKKYTNQEYRMYGPLGYL